MKLKYINLLSCKDFTELACKSHDHPLQGWERIFFIFHHTICTVCRRFHRQTKLIDTAAKGALKNSVENSTAISLSESAKARIAEKLREGRPH